MGRAGQTAISSTARRSKKAAAGRAAADLLIEIGTEELPHHFVAPAIRSLGDIAAQLLSEHRLSHGEIETCATPRRLTVLVRALADRQAPTITEAMGPPKSAAFDPHGRPTKAALGFAASQGLAVERLEVRQTAKGEYVCAVKREPGRPAREVLRDMLPAMIKGLSFPKTMRWNASGFRFARPIRWLVALYGGRVVPFEVGGVRAGNRTWGHRFLTDRGGRSAHPLQIRDIRQYLTALERAGVIVQPERRRAMIRSKLARLAASVQGHPEYDEGLLEQAVFSVELPDVILGTFDPAYLAVPEDVLKTAMKEHQGFFPVLGREGRLSPCFLSVTNTRLRDMALIREGNERVLAARLADARFFFEEDRKLALAERVEKLKTVTFHHKLGTLHQKTGRVMALTAKIADALGDLDVMETAKRAAQLSKTDLLTGMVGEFPSLQGIMGGEYARRDGESEPVSCAIREHYLPRAMEGGLPTTLAGKVLSLADRLDTVAAFFHVGIVPTGSEDPFGLRRHASAIVRILVEGGVRLDLREILAHARKNVETQGFPRESEPGEGGRPRVVEPEDFVLERLRFYGRSVHGLREDVMEAVIKGAAGRPLDLVDLLARMRAFQAISERPEFDPLIVGFTRAYRLTRKEAWDHRAVDAGRFEHEAERALYEGLQDAVTRVPDHLAQGHYQEGLECLVGLKPKIDAFFERVMVNADDPDLRANRLSLLESVANLFLSYADFSAVMVENR